MDRVEFSNLKSQWTSAEPFHHLIIDDFLDPDIAMKVVNEFPPFDGKEWHIYDNAIEIKKTHNNWNMFGPETYKLFTFFNSRAFIDELEVLTDCRLYADPGLNGGGLHTHRSGGKLNTHLDYSLHPKLGLERRINLLVYMTPEWKPAWGGALGLWRQHPEKKIPGDLVKSITPVFNRAVLFDTTQQSWHGLPEPVACPDSITRNSLAVYYLCDPREKVDPRGRALFAPYKEQENDAAVLELIKKRSSVTESVLVYRK